MRRLTMAALAILGLASLSADAVAAPGFKPEEGRYRGEYTGGDHGPGKVRLEVGPLRPGLHGVELLRWSGELECKGGGTESVAVPMTAARVGRTFSGFTSSTAASLEYRFTGRFTAADALEAKVRVTRGEGAERCDTGPITFAAHRVGP